MPPYPLFVAFHYDTDGNDHFARAADALRRRCEALRIDLEACDRTEAVAAFAADFQTRHENYGSMRHICHRYVPIFIEEMVARHPGPIFYLHCDSEILRRPPAEAFADLDVGYAEGASRTGQRHILGSPVFLRPSTTGRSFLAIWSQMCRLVDTSRAEHRMLTSTIAAFDGHPRVRRFDVQMGSRDRSEDPYIFC